MHADVPNAVIAKPIRPPRRKDGMSFRGLARSASEGSNNQCIRMGRRQGLWRSKSSLSRRPRNSRYRTFLDRYVDAHQWERGRDGEEEAISADKNGVSANSPCHLPNRLKRMWFGCGGQHPSLFLSSHLLS